MISGLRIVVLASASLLFSGLAHASVVTVNGFTDKVGGTNCTDSHATSASCSTVDVTAVGDLSTGLLGIKADCCAAPSSTGQSGGNATYSDAFTLVLPTGFAGTTVPFVTMHFTVSNPILHGGSTTANAAKIQESLTLTPHFSSFFSTTANGCVSTDQADFCTTLPATLDLTVTVSNIPVTDLKYSFSVFMDVIARGTGSEADTLDPGQISIQLPTGFTFTSDSGELLVAPEPASFFFLTPILAGLMALRRRR
jgi:hypothetical protein